MNRYLMLFLLGLFVLPVSETVNAQPRSRPYAEFSIGSINPKDTGVGNVFGISTGRRLYLQIARHVPCRSYAGRLILISRSLIQRRGNRSYLDVHLSARGWSL